MASRADTRAGRRRSAAVVRKRSSFEQAGQLRGGCPIRQWYNKAARSMPGTLFVVATPIGNLEDITARALRVLREVVADRRRRHAADRASAGALRHHHADHQPSRAQRSAEDRRRSSRGCERGENVALVSDAGTPTISDPGSGSIGRRSRPASGSSRFPGRARRWPPWRCPGLPSESFTFLGFPPTRSKDRNDWFERAASDRRHVVVSSRRRIGSGERSSSFSAIVGDCRVARRPGTDQGPRGIGQRTNF